jgi:cobalt/nickel transport system permease protein
MAGSIAGAIAALQLGAFSVVLQTVFSGKTELPFTTFVLLMQPIHLAIGVVEGIITGSILSFVWRARPEILDNAAAHRPIGTVAVKKIIIVLAIATIITGGVLSWFASTHPDGLEWSMQKTSGKEELETPDGIHKSISRVQETTSLLPDYGLKPALNDDRKTEENSPSWPNPDAGTTLSGLIGGGILFVLISAAGLLIWLFKRRKKNQTPC